MKKHKYINIPEIEFKTMYSLMCKCNVEPPKTNQMNKIEITKINGKWLINGKLYNELVELNRFDELIFFNEFLLAMKWDYEMIQQDKFNQN